MKEILVGYTGFVGSNISKNHKFDGLYNSKNIEDAFGTKPDVLVYCGIPAQKYIANRYPDEDMNIILNAINNIKLINPKKVILISTIDVYNNPIDVDEDTNIDDTNSNFYGKNRLYLENWIKDNYKDYLIVRLPGLYGDNIKKNFIYDMINIIPNMLDEKKYNELLSVDDSIKNYYEKQENGFYKYLKIKKESVLEYFKKVNFNALNFTDSRSIYQFYNLNYLWNHIEIALNNNIKLLNIATEPISASELYKYINDELFDNKITDNIPNYNFKTKYFKIFNGKDGYVFDKDFILEDIKKFVENKKKNIKLSISNIAWSKENDDEVYSYLMENGINAVEIAPTRLVGDNPYDKIDMAVDKVKEIKSKYNLSISSMQSIWFGKSENLFSSEENYKILVDYTKKAIDFAASINCSNIVFGVPKNRKMDNYKENYPIAINFFNEIGNYASKYNITIAIEPIPIIYGTNFLNTTEEAIEFVKKINRDNIKINYDFGTVIENNEDINILKDNINYINHVHISEPNLVYIKNRDDHKKLINLLKELNYDKFISIEMKNMDDIEGIKNVINYITNIV